MKIEVGKYYRTRDGRKVGPMRNDRGIKGRPFDCPGTAQFYGLDGTADDGPEYDLIAEWTYAPKLWRDMTDAEKGALLLAHHEAAMIEYCLLGNGEWRPIAEPVFAKGHAYRVKPAAPREFWIVGGCEAWDSEVKAREHARSLTATTEIVHVREVLE